MRSRLRENPMRTSQRPEHYETRGLGTSTRKRCRPTGLSIALLLALLSSPFGLPGASHAAGEDHRILLVGSSFTSGVKAKLKSLIEQTLGESVSIAVKTDEDQLYFHYQDFLSNSADQALLAEGWDWVVLQEQSYGTSRVGFPGYLGANYTDMQDLKGVIDQHSPGAAVALFMTWEYERSGSIPAVACDPARAICPDWHYLRGDVSCGDATDPENACTGYAPVARTPWVDGPVAPVGQVFRDLGTVVNGDLVAIRGELFGNDKKHASSKGKYTAALTIFLSLFGQRFTELPANLWAPGGWDADFVAEVQQAAWDAVREETAVWNNPMAWHVSVPIGASTADASQPLFQNPIDNGVSLPFTNLVIVGLRFDPVGVPADATIVDAHIDAEARFGGLAAYPIDVESELLLPVDGVPLDRVYGTGDRLPSGTGVGWTWHPDPWSGWVSVADITSPVQALVNHAAWAEDESMTFLLHGWIDGWTFGGPGARDVWSFDGGVPPSLEIDYLY